MSVTPQHGTTVDYWLGWVAGALKAALRLADAVDPDTGEPIHDCPHVVASVRRSWDQFIEAGTPVYTEGRDGAHGLAYLDDDLYDGFVVEAADGEPQALAATWEQARERLVDTERYWDEVAACGHPSAPGYVNALWPFRIRQITKRERADILDNGTPTLDREP